MEVINRDGAAEAFEDEKLYNSAFYPSMEAELGEERSNEIAEKVVWEVKAWMDKHEVNRITTREIRDKVEQVLENQNKDAAFMYNTHLDIN